MLIVHEWGNTSLGVKNSGQRKLKSKEVDKSKVWKEGGGSAELPQVDKIALQSPNAEREH